MRALGFALGVCLGFADVGAIAQTSTGHTSTSHPSYVAPGSAPASSDASSPTLEAVATAPLACGGAIPWTEAKAIAGTGRAVRSGTKLTVGGVTFQDVAARNSREPKLYDYVGVFGASGLDLVRVTGREESSYLLLDVRTRSRVELHRFPVPSPSNRFYAVATPESADRRGGVEVVERTPSGVQTIATIPRADLVDDPCRLTNLTWVADDRFVVRVGRPGAKGSGVAVTYRLNNGKWQPA